MTNDRALYPHPIGGKKSRQEPLKSYVHQVSVHEEFTSVPKVVVE